MPNKDDIFPNKRQNFKTSKGKPIKKETAKLWYRKDETTSKCPLVFVFRVFLSQEKCAA